MNLSHIQAFWNATYAREGRDVMTLLQSGGMQSTFVWELSVVNINILNKEMLTECHCTFV